jgi:hypothetical protein
MGLGFPETEIAAAEFSKAESVSKCDFSCFLGCTEKNSRRDADQHRVTRPTSDRNTHLQISRVYDSIGKPHHHLREPEERRQTSDELNRKRMIHLL